MCFVPFCCNELTCTDCLVQNYVFGSVVFEKRETYLNDNTQLLNPAQVTSAQFGQTVLLLKLKISSRSRRKLVLSVAAFFRRSFGQSYRNLHKFCSFQWGTKICPNWLMVAWGTTKYLHKDPS